MKKGDNILFAICTVCLLAIVGVVLVLVMNHMSGYPALTLEVKQVLLSVGIACCGFAALSNAILKKHQNPNQKYKRK